MHPYLRCFILDRMGWVVQFQKNMHFLDPFIEMGKFFEFFLNVSDQFSVCIKMHRLNDHVHGTKFIIGNERTAGAEIKHPQASS